MEIRIPGQERAGYLARDVYNFGRAAVSVAGVYFQPLPRFEEHREQAAIEKAAVEARIDVIAARHPT